MDVIKPLVGSLGVSCALVMLGACAWVNPVAGADAVILVKSEHVYNCKRLGETLSHVKSKITVIERRESKIADELIALAKNEAVKLGGDSIVALGTPEDGHQKFEIYRCQP